MVIAYLKSAMELPLYDNYFLSHYLITTHVFFLTSNAIKQDIYI